MVVIVWSSRRDGNEKAVQDGANDSDNNTKKPATALITVDESLTKPKESLVGILQ